MVSYNSLPSLPNVRPRGVATYRPSLKYQWSRVNDLSGRRAMRPGNNAFGDVKRIVFVGN